VSNTLKGGTSRQVSLQEMTARESLKKHRKQYSDDDKTGECAYFREKGRGNLFTACLSSGVEMT
jgi:hypothetical protein